jgi:hypothetical protein
MDPDNLKQAWKAQSSRTRLTIDSELLLKEFQRNQRHFTDVIFRRDARELIVCLLTVPVWLFLGVKFSLPWTWYLAVPAVVWIAGYMLVDRMRHKWRSPEPGDPLRQGVECALAEYEHQIRLLRNVHWWYLLPCAVAVLAFVGEVTWQHWSEGGMAVVASIVVAIIASVFGGVYWLNQFAIRVELEPRRQELKALLMSLKDEAPDAISSANDYRQ